MCVAPQVGWPTVTDEELTSLAVACEAAQAALDAFRASVVAEATRRELPDRAGRNDPAGWWRATTGAAQPISRTAAAVAEATTALPEVGQALAAGDLTASHAAALARAARDVGPEALRDDSDFLLDAARTANPETLARRVRQWVASSRVANGIARPDAARAERTATSEPVNRVLPGF